MVKYNEIHFTITINPSNGPGSTTWPPAPFISAVKQLIEHSNVRTLG